MFKVLKCANHNLHYSTKYGCPHCRYDSVTQELKKENVTLEEQFRNRWNTDYWYEGSPIEVFYKTRKFHTDIAHSKIVISKKA
jgi:hypothetical protein